MAFRARPMRNETVQAWLLGKLVHEGLDAPPTGADRNAMNEFIRAVTKDANCNGDMRRFNMFNFLDRVGRFMTEEYRAWKDWFDNL